MADKFEKHILNHFCITFSGESSYADEPSNPMFNQYGIDKN